MTNLIESGRIQKEHFLITLPDQEFMILRIRKLYLERSISIGG